VGEELLCGLRRHCRRDFFIRVWQTRVQSCKRSRLHNYACCPSLLVFQVLLGIGEVDMFLQNV